MSDSPQGAGWWQAEDGKWHPPEAKPDQPATSSEYAPPSAAPGPMGSPQGPSTGGPSAASPGEAFNYGWLKFQQNIGPIILASLVGLAILILITIVSYLISSAAFLADDDASFALVFLGSMFVMAGWFFGYFLFNMAIIRGALMTTYGEKLEIGKMFSTEQLGQYLLASLFVTIASFIGAIFCFIPALIVWFLTQFFGFFLLDKKMSAFDAIMASVRLVNRNLGSLVGFYIGAIIALVIGTLICGVGLLLAVPVVIIATGFMYRRLQGEAVAP